MFDKMNTRNLDKKDLVRIKDKWDRVHYLNTNEIDAIKERFALYTEDGVKYARLPEDDKRRWCGVMIHRANIVEVAGLEIKGRKK